MDRADIQNAVKEICKTMASPTVGCRRKLKRLARYLITNPRVVSKFEYQNRAESLDGYSDSDWAGCRKSAKSTVGE